jgi:hypothetical protein
MNYMHAVNDLSEWFIDYGADAFNGCTVLAEILGGNPTPPVPAVTP